MFLAIAAVLPLCSPMTGVAMGEAVIPSAELSAADRARVAKLHAAALATIEHGDLAAAKLQLAKILSLAPYDASAQRDAGRVAMAAGEFEHAVRVLEQSQHFGGHHRDPELHYLRGEGLYALGNTREARKEHRIAELEMGTTPRDRMSRLWKARIHARRGELALADAIYETLWPPAGQEADEEVALNQAEAHLLAKDWPGAVRVLRRFLAQRPDHRRAREMLAWALEAGGDLDGELAVRRKLAADASSAQAVRDYGRALERARDERGAFAAYRRATALDGSPDAILVAARDRMRFRTTPEVAGGLILRSEPAATGQHVRAGAALPFGSRHLFSLLGWHDTTSGGFPAASAKVTGISGALALEARWGGRLTLGGQVHGFDRTAALTEQSLPGGNRLAWGQTVAVETPLGALVKLDLRGERDNQWNEASIAIQEGGQVTGLTGHVYITPIPWTRRLLIDTGVQARRLRLAVNDETATRGPAATQLMGWGGADLVVWHDPSRVLRGEILDDNLVRNTEISDAVTLSYRHYELFGQSDSAFLARIALTDRSSVDMGSLVARTTLDTRWLALVIRAGIGYDHARGKSLSQAGGSLYAMVTNASRLMLSYDLAQETSTGLVGTRHTGWVVYHADL